MWKMRDLYKAQSPGTNLVQEPQKPPMMLEKMSPCFSKISSPEKLGRKALLGMAY